MHSDTQNLQIFNRFPFLILLLGLKSLLLSWLVIVYLCSPIFAYKCYQHYFFTPIFCFSPEDKSNGIFFSSALTYCRGSTYSSVQSSMVFRVVLTFNKWVIKRVLCWWLVFNMAAWYSLGLQALHRAFFIS